MKFIITLILLGSMLLFGCSHSIVITPELQSLERKHDNYIQATAGYYISSHDRNKVVTTPGGGGDRIHYYPYKELEPALQKVLFNVFDDVKRLDLLPSPEYLRANDIDFAFLPEITTNSSSNSIFTWPPTNFTIDLTCKAFSQEGKLIWERKYTGVGTATFSEFKSDFSLAPKRAGHIVFSEMLTDLYNSPVFKK